MLNKKIDLEKTYLSISQESQKNELFCRQKQTERSELLKKIDFLKLKYPHIQLPTSMSSTATSRTNGDTINNNENEINNVTNDNHVLSTTSSVEFESNGTSTAATTTTTFTNGYSSESVITETSQVLQQPIVNNSEDSTHALVLPDNTQEVITVITSFSDINIIDDHRDLSENTVNTAKNSTDNTSSSNGNNDNSNINNNNLNNVNENSINNDTYLLPGKLQVQASNGMSGDDSSNNSKNMPICPSTINTTASAAFRNLNLGTSLLSTSQHSISDFASVNNNNNNNNNNTSTNNSIFHDTITNITTTNNNNNSRPVSISPSSSSSSSSAARRHGISDPGY